MNNLRKSRVVVAVGQFPPPIGGFSFITESIVNHLKRREPITSVNVAAKNGCHGIRKILSRMTRTLRACATIASASSSPDRICYIACEGGLGLFYTLFIVLIAKIFSYKTILHHHSFNYVDHHRRLMQVILYLNNNMTHVYLCLVMQSCFERTYNCTTQSHILSNAAFVNSQTAIRKNGPQKHLTIGHLSNLTQEKGLHIFLELLRRSNAAGLDIHGILAGPTNVDDDLMMIRSAVDELKGKLEYRGPLYRSEKDDFYRNIDAFIFPTQYINEAQPTVIFEAMAAGCAIASFNRGCIATQIGAAGLVVERHEDFIEKTIMWLKNLVEDKSNLEQLSDQVLKIFAEHRTRALESLDSFLCD
jgi:glycosyltransferase involved in cell wall biosynthesis